MNHLQIIHSTSLISRFFGGYNRYIFKRKIEFLYKFFPFRIRILIGQIINIIPEKMIHAFELLINKFLIKNQNYNQIYEKLKKLAVLLIECKSNNEIYLKIYSNYGNNLSIQNSSATNNDLQEINDFISSKLKNYSKNGFITEMYLKIFTYQATYCIKLTEHLCITA